MFLHFLKNISNIVGIDGTQRCIVIIEGENMEYTVQKLAQVTGVSTRTLRYYNEEVIFIRLNSV